MRRPRRCRRLLQLSHGGVPVADRPPVTVGLVPLAIRPAEASDADFLAEMLVAAAFWRTAGPSGSVT